MPSYRKMLTEWEAPYIQSLVKLAETQSKGTLANWCIPYAETRLLPVYEAAYPGDLRPKNALIAARARLGGAIKFPQAKAAILVCHAAAREAEGNPAAQAAARAIAQCASTIHVPSHCMGLALYGALALAYDKLATNAPWPQLEQAAAEECARMEAALLAVSIEAEGSPAKRNWKC